MKNPLSWCKMDELSKFVMAIKKKIEFLVPVLISKTILG